MRRVNGRVYIGGIVGFPPEVVQQTGRQGPGWLLDLGNNSYSTAKGHYYPNPPTSPEHTPQEATNLVARDKADYPSIFVAGPATKTYNCHGYTFFIYPQLRDGVALPDAEKIVIEGGGTAQNPAGAVRRIIDDNGWRNVTNQGPYQKDDVILYRKTALQRFQHSGRVFSVNPDGSVREVISKWGENGLYVHPVDQVLPQYGSVKTIFRYGRRLTGKRENDRAPKKESKSGK